MNALFYEHWKNPPNVGVFQESDSSVGSARVGTPEQGVVIELYVQADAGFIHISNACFRAYGNPAVIASTSWTTQWLIGKSLEAARQPLSQDLIQALEIPTHQMHNLLYVQQAVQLALQDLSKKINKIK